MKLSFINYLFLQVAFFAIAQNAAAQWTTTPGPPTYLQPLNNGRAGIGTANPSQALQIVGGNILLDKTNVQAYTGNIFLGGVTYNNGLLGTGMRLSYDANNNGFIDVRNTSGFTTTTDGLIFRIDNNPNNAYTERMRITNSGNVGIGIVPTLHRLHVHNGTVMISGTNFGGGPMLLFGRDPVNFPSGNWGIEYVSSLTDPNQRGLNFWQPFNNPAPPGSAPGNNYLFLHDINGAVSISTDKFPSSVGTNNTSAYRLFVKGGILTDELLVQNGWADYVFEKGYSLPALSEVERQIAEKGHLPNVPSEKEVLENGLNVGKMAATQQEKIEELFLYVIQLNKDVQALRAENESLRQMLNTQKTVSDEK